MILAQICDELLCGQVQVYGRKERRMDKNMGNDNTSLAWKAMGKKTFIWTNKKPRMPKLWGYPIHLTHCGQVIAYDDMGLGQYWIK